MLVISYWMLVWVTDKRKRIEGNGIINCKLKWTRSVAWFNTSPCHGEDRRFESGRVRQMASSEISNNQSIAKMLFDVAAVLEVTGGDRFRIRAYQEAAKSIESYPVEVRDLWEHGNLGDVSGVGNAIAGYLEEFFKTGRRRHF